MRPDKLIDPWVIKAQSEVSNTSINVQRPLAQSRLFKRHIFAAVTIPLPDQGRHGRQSREGRGLLIERKK